MRVTLKDDYIAKIETANIYSRLVALCQLFITQDRQYDKDSILSEMTAWGKELERRGPEPINEMFVQYDAARRMAAERADAVRSFDAQYIRSDI